MQSGDRSGKAAHQRWRSVVLFNAADAKIIVQQSLVDCDRKKERMAKIQRSEFRGEREIRVRLGLGTDLRPEEDD